MRSPSTPSAQPRHADEAPQTAAVKSARDRLLDVANELFYRRGIRSVGIDEIIAQAGVAKMSLYRSFASKDELVVAYLKKRDAQYWRWWEGILARHPGSPRQQLRDLFEGLAAQTARPNWRGCPFTNAATEFPERDHPARKVAAANKHELRRRLRELAKAIGVRDPATLADQLVLLFEGAYSSVQTFENDIPARQVTQAAEALIKAQQG